MPVDLSPAALQHYAAQYSLAAQPYADAAGSVAGKPPASAKWPYWLLAAGQGADAASTVAALQNPNLQEGNPLGKGGMLAAKAGVGLSLAYLMHKAEDRGDERSKKIIGTIGGLLGIVPAALNVRTMVQNR